MEHLSTRLSKLSWQQLQADYTVLGFQLGEYANVARRIDIPHSMDISLTDSDNIFILRFWRDVNRIDGCLRALDKEIARRNQLIGVMG